MQFLKYSHSSSEFRKVLFWVQFCVQYTLTTSFLSVPKRCLSASYVDDCKLYLSFSPAELTRSIYALNEDLMRISQWCCKRSLLINPDKTKVLAVGVPQLLQKLSSFSITLFDKELAPVPVVKDLSVFLDTRFSYNEHTTKTASNCLLN